MLAYTTLEAARGAIAMDERVSQIGVIIADGANQQAVAASLRQALTGGEQPGIGALEVLTWQEAIPEMVGLLEFDQAMSYIYVIVIFIIVLFAIANTFLMAVMERVREYGLLNAVGLSPRRIGALVIWESALLAMIAMAVGFALGFAMHAAVAQVGINPAEMGAGDFEMAGIGVSDMIIRSKLNPLKWFVGSVCVFVVVMFSALYPAWRATRLAPAEAMRFYE